jgi:hypothetical protein
MPSPRSKPDLVAALEPIDEALSRLAREVRLLGAVTPQDAARERARLVASFERGVETDPRWRYAPLDRSDARRRADVVVRELEALPDAPLTRVYLGRARELGEEAALVDAIGTRAFGALAAARFAATSAGGASAARAASELAREWLAPADEGPLPTRRSDDAADARSLLSRMREEVTRLRLPFEVVTSDSLAALAAIGDVRIWVTTARDVSDADVERTIVHELYGHALPRARAARLRLGIFSAGTARGGDDQEGLALVLEERAGYLGTRRKRELAGRHTVIERMAAGATFVEAVRALEAARFTPAEAVRMAERAYRGGDGLRPGLGRERVYLESFVLVRERLARAPGDEAVLSAGQVALDAVDVLRPFAAGAAY